MTQFSGIRRPLLFLKAALLVAFAFAAAVAATPPLQPAALLLAPDGERLDRFGSAIALDGDAAVVGATGWNGDSGAVYVFTSQFGRWAARARLLASLGEGHDFFGIAADLDGGTLAVGAPGVDRSVADGIFNVGSVTVYSGAGALWEMQTRIMPDDLVSMNEFGHDLALAADTLIVGAPNSADDTNEAAYVYRREGTAWTLQAKLAAPGGAATDRNFGYAVALAGDMALVGAPGLIEGDGPRELVSGEVYVFTRSGDKWSPAVSLLPEDGQDGDGFGCALDLDGSTVVIIACQAAGLAFDGGTAYVFVHDGERWVQQARLAPDLGGKHFDLDDGAVRGDRIVLGSSDAPRPDGIPSGAAFVFTRAGGIWTQDQTIQSAEGQERAMFGHRVALADDHMMIGAPNWNVGIRSTQGAVFDYRPRDQAGYHAFLPVAIGRPPLVAPDDLIVYTDEVNFIPDIFTIHADGSGKTNLTNSLEPEYFPRWSPDRRRIAFVRLFGSAAQLITMNVDGSDQRVVNLPEMEHLDRPDWSPDGTKIAIGGEGTDPPLTIYRVMVFNLDGSDLVVIGKESGYSTFQPAWSPDGQLIGLILATGGRPPEPTNRDIAIARADGQPFDDWYFDLVTSSEQFESFPDWLLSEEGFIYSRHPDDDLFILKSGFVDVLIENAPYGVWAHDGNHIVFHSDQGGIYYADADGGNITLVDPSRRARTPDW